jgi:formate dehydrogenase accessory protein FdhE
LTTIAQTTTVARDTWPGRVQRAADLAATEAPSRALLLFYAGLLRAQRDLYGQLCVRSDWLGTPERDLAPFRTHVTNVLDAVASAGPELLAVEARQLMQAASVDFQNMLLRSWEAPSDRQFFGKAILQPYAQCLRERGVVPVGRAHAAVDNRCPFCGGVPQLSMLRGGGDPALQGGERALQCATCLAVWPFRRGLCPQCGEEDERRLGYFSTPAFEHLRLETCEGCKHYLKCVDLTQLGVAVPLVDEVAGAPLDIWAAEHGYIKIELNLVGL